MLFDLENRTRNEITDTIQNTLGKTQLVKRREYLESMQDHNPAEFGEKCERHCICEVQGQRCCTGLIVAPKQNRGRWRWNHNMI